MEKEAANDIDNFSEDERIVINKAVQFRNQALCVKTNIRILSLMWELNPQFKELKIGCFYGMMQDDCIFRIVLETYKLLYDNQGNSKTITGMANDCYNRMIKMKKFCEMKNELLSKKKDLAKSLKKYSSLDDIIKGRNEIYAHNDQTYHWFNPSYLESFRMTDEIYQSILEVSDICINYCNGILKMFGQKEVFEYSNSDDIKRLFGLKTEREEEQELIDSILGI